jgi:hypothetical protein
MAVSYSTSLRNARLDAITTAVGTSGLLRIYAGTRPATANTAITDQTLLAELTCSSAFAAAAASGVLTANAITEDSSANATGTASFARLTTSGGTAVADLSVATSGAEVTINTTSIVSGRAVQCSSLVITAGNG